MLSESTQRVPEHTASYVNERIKRQTEENVERFASSGRKAMDARLEELDREWDIERTIEANASALALIGVILGARLNRKWLMLPAVVAGFLLQHSLQGWCPPVPVLRRLGFRTRNEIDQEKYALKALRGDFIIVSETRKNAIRTLRALEAVRH